MSLIEKWAEKVIAKKEAKEAKKAVEDEKQKILRGARREVIEGFRKQFVEAEREKYSKRALPEFAVDEKVLTNYFSGGDSWQGSVFQLQAHTPFEGPIVVKVKEVVIDSTFLSERIYDMIDIDLSVFDGITTYDGFVNYMIDRMTRWIDYLPISWGYKIKVPGDDATYWQYSWREAKLLKLDSKEAKKSITAWKTRQKRQKAYDEYQVLDEEYKKRLSKLEEALYTLKKY